MTGVQTCALPISADGAGDLAGGVGSKLASEGSQPGVDRAHRRAGGHADPGAAVEQRHLDLLADAVVTLAADATWVVLAGSLPPGAPAGWYAELVGRLRGTNAQVAVDTSEAPLAALAAALPAAAPDLMKPNGEELATLTGGDPVALESDPAAAASALARTTGSSSSSSR